jgi:hypothetical protein
LALRSSLATAVGKVEPLSPHLGTDTSVVDIQHKPAVCSIRQVEVPHVLERTLVDDSALRSRSRATKGVAAIRDGRHLGHYLDGKIQQALLGLAVGNSWLDL